MSRMILRSPHDWLIVGLVAAAAFIYFTAGAAVLALIADTSPNQTLLATVMHFVLALVIAAAMLGMERRRPSPSVDSAVLDGIQVAAVIIIANNLTGVTETGARLAARSALILIGLPLLTVLTHLLAQRIRARTAHDGSG